VISLLPLVGAFVIGLSKAGFATGLGMVVTPLLATAMPARQAIGVLLPLLLAADALTLAVYWKQWDFGLVRTLLVGTIVGIAGGTFFVTSISDRALSFSIGVVGLILVGLLIVRNVWFPGHTYRPSWPIGVAVGIAAGFSSTIAHAAGPIVALYLLAQRPHKEAFVATSGIFFALNNALKVPPYIASGLITGATLRADLWYLPGVPLGVGAGWLVQRLIPQRRFDFVVYALLLLTSLHLIVSNAP
jgi:uncharacterized membrane protein YfcA